jgi:hypothetical protein
MARSRRPVIALVAGVSAVCVLAATAAGAGNGTLGPRGAVLREPGEELTRPLSPVQGCQVLLDTGEGDCAVVETENGQLVFTVEAGAPVDEVLITRPWIVRVYRPSQEAGRADQWTVALATEGQGTDPGPLYADVKAEIGDVTGDGSPELLVGYRSEGTGQILDIDIVGTTADGTPHVLAHTQLYKGSAKIKGGKLLTWMPVYKKTDANCCPTWIRRDVVRYEGGKFVVHKGKKVPTAQANIPPGDF